MIDITAGPTRGILNLRGACPLCGETVHRRVTRVGGAVEESYSCRLDGMVRYRHGTATRMEMPVYPDMPGLDPRLAGEGPAPALVGSV